MVNYESAHHPSVSNAIIGGETSIVSSIKNSSLKAVLPKEMISAEQQSNSSKFRNKFAAQMELRDLFNVSKTADTSPSDAMLARSNEVQTVYDSKKTLAETDATPNQLHSNQSSASKIFL